MVAFLNDPVPGIGLPFGIPVARRHRDLVDGHRKDRKAVRRLGQRGIEHPARLFIGRDRRLLRPRGAAGCGRWQTWPTRLTRCGRL